MSAVDKLGWAEGSRSVGAPRKAGQSPGFGEGRALLSRLLEAEDESRAMKQGLLFESFGLVASQPGQTAPRLEAKLKGHIKSWHALLQPSGTATQRGSYAASLQGCIPSVVTARAPASRPSPGYQEKPFFIKGSVWLV